jgi:1-acyl-sn-glycerol-3-phosphate acyltransferase
VLKELYYLPPYILQRLFWPFSRIFFPFFLNIKVTGLENFKNLKGGEVFASSHRSHLDPILVTLYLPFCSPALPMFYVSREKDKYSGYLKLLGGWFFRMWGAYPAITGIKNYEESLKRHVEIINDKRCVLIFPDGGICSEKESEEKEIKGGVAYLAHATNTSIVPVHITGVYKITMRDFFLRKRKVSIHYGAPIIARELFVDPANATLEDIKKAALKVRLAIQGLNKETEVVSLIPTDKLSSSV